ncbi:MAG: NfeD family protein [Gammaproteobacteria bacterium]|nr:NfeD family protein [Gammaproteobacteria bacterium]
MLSTAKVMTLVEQVEMVEYINNHPSGFWIALGFVLLAAEVLLFGFTTIIFLFAGLGALAAGLLMSAGLIPETWIAGTACFGIATGVSSAILWKPLMSMQNRSAPVQKPSSDIVGLEFVLADDISAAVPGRYRYSGIDWKVALDKSSAVDELTKGTRVVVVTVGVGLLGVIKVGQ